MKFFLAKAEIFLYFLRMPGWWNGRHGGLKILFPIGSTGSSPVLGTMKNQKSFVLNDFSFENMFLTNDISSVLFSHLNCKIMSEVLSEKINLTSSYPRAPEVIRFGDKLVSASDYGEEQTEKLLRNRGFSEQDVLDIMLFRLECKQGHGYKKVQTRRSGDRYIDHPNGVALMLLLEFGETDVALIQAAMGHDTLEDVALSRKYYPELLKRVA